VALGFWLQAMPPATAAPLVALCSVAGHLQSLPRIMAGVRWPGLWPFLVGGAAYLLAQTVIASRAEGGGRMWMIYLAVATDLFGDGLLIGSGSAVAASLGLTLAIGQVLADVPEGAATTITFQANGVPKKKRLLLAVMLVLPVVAGAALSYVTLRDQSEALQLSALVATSGLFAVAVFEDLITEAHEASEDSRTSTAFLLVGFAVFTLVSAGLG